MDSVFIQSPGNARIKEIRRLRERKYLKDSPLFYMEGTRIVGEAFRAAPCAVETLIVAPELIRSDFAAELAGEAAKKGIEVLTLSAAAFGSISIKENPQGIAALGRKRPASFADLAIEPGLYLALNSVADPGNLGTMIRTADAVDCRGVFLIGDSVSPYDIGAIRGSMGAVFTQKIVTTSYDAFLDWKREYGIRLIGTADSAASDYLEIDIPDTVIVMMGSEREGLTGAQLADCDAVARIPMLRSCDSLNLAVATGVMLYQAYNVQRGYHLRK